MRHFNRYVLVGLVAAAIFVIFNCAGYLFISLLLSTPTSPQNAARQAAGGAPAAVVSFTTATLAPTVSAGPTLVVPTPAPLLPTITPAPPTATPTATMRSIKAPSPPVSQTPLAAAAPGQLVIVSHKSYVDSLGWYHIVGEVQNNSSTPMEYVEIVAKLYNASAEVIGTKLTFTAPDVIFPGGSAPFDIVALRQSQWRNIETYTLHVEGDASAGLQPQNVILLNQNSQLQNGLMVVSGQVQNTGETPILAKIIVTLYDANHNVINTSWSYADAGIMARNEIADFEVKVRHDTDPNNFFYRIQIEEEPVDSK